ncbi:hypothetical protein BDN72DRAFT_779492 [Pluteus cervinus]|uniref:Uncharacterized protein n=1 Tax=Pluteus cervinus TaxID=181527 RepID=A0ACD3A6D3_9AGAR|nr:hypothetical protein BDN72DRAFT_779492 [Pluteus cervinus]
MGYETRTSTPPFGPPFSLDLGKKTLNRYYSLTDESVAYRIAMVLHPRHKLEYFRSAGWEDSWVDEAECLFRAEYDENYAPVDLDGNEQVAGDDSAAERDNNSQEKVCSSVSGLLKR